MVETKGDLQRLADLAASLRPRLVGEKPLPRLLFVTDPVRTPEPEAVAARLPAGSGLIYRAFGAAGALDRARRLRTIATDRKLLLLIGADADLALEAQADGLHLPERALDDANALKAARPGWTITGAAHSLEAAQRAFQAGCDAILVSTVFLSHSPSASQPMGAEGFKQFATASPLPVYALGGVNVKTAPELIGSGAAGFAMVEGLADAV